MTNRGLPGRRRRPVFEPPDRQLRAELNVPVPPDPLPGEAAPLQYEPGRKEPITEAERLGSLRRRVREKQMLATGKVDESLVPDRLPAGDESKVPVALRLPEGLVEAIHSLAEMEGTTFTWLVEQALSDLLAAPPRDPQLVREDMAAKYGAAMSLRWATKRPRQRKAPDSES